MKEQITLCARCAKEYRMAGYRIRPDYTVDIKEPCEKCGRPGFTYWIIRDIKRYPNYDK